MYTSGDILYCWSDDCDCIVKVCSRGATRDNTGQVKPGYEVANMGAETCTFIHDDCCAKNAIKVSETFLKYLQLFKSPPDY